MHILRSAVDTITCLPRHTQLKSKCHCDYPCSILNTTNQPCGMRQNPNVSRALCVLHIVRCQMVDLEVPHPQFMLGGLTFRYNFDMAGLLKPQPPHAF